ncbi:MAG TPA: hypothetical protein VKZ41_09820 [Gemmatimonadales bacterium]|nr:hypothetical protein [Gemmatimonadales bacterium]
MTMNRSIMDHSSAPEPDASASDLLALVLSKRRLIARSTILVALAVGLIILALPRTYTVEVSTLPIAPTLPGGRVAGLAAQFGLGAIGTPAGQSPDFYATYLQSREIRLQAIERRVEFQQPAGWFNDGKPMWGDGSVLGLLNISSGDSLRARELAIAKLLDMVTVSVDRLAGTVNLKVTSQWAPFSTELANIYLDLLIDFNKEQRQSQAGAERRFVESRIQTARAELRQAEGSMQSFLERNRSWQSSPALILQHDRLGRDVSLKQSIVTSLAQSFEQARLDEVRDTPLLIVVQRATLPGMPDRRGLPFKVLGAAIAACFAATILVILADLLERARIGSRRSRDLSELLEATWQDCRAPWKLIL